uniref:Smr domain-containing protein n=1 Tax=Aplanochytrium stocchinoi TaxID=215587 RepID=A0A7S3PGW0_9STRA
MLSKTSLFLFPVRSRTSAGVYRNRLGQQVNFSSVKSHEVIMSTHLSSIDKQLKKIRLSKQHVQGSKQKILQIKNNLECNLNKRKASTSVSKGSRKRDVGTRSANVSVVQERSQRQTRSKRQKAPSVRKNHETVLSKNLKDKRAKIGEYFALAEKLFDEGNLARAAELSNTCMLELDSLATWIPSHRKHEKRYDWLLRDSFIESVTSNFLNWEKVMNEYEEGRYKRNNMIANVANLEFDRYLDKFVHARKPEMCIKAFTLMQKQHELFKKNISQEQLQEISFSLINATLKGGRRTTHKVEKAGTLDLVFGVLEWMDRKCGINSPKLSVEEYNDLMMACIRNFERTNDGNSLHKVKTTFKIMESEGLIPSIRSWTLLIACHGRLGDVYGAFDVMSELQRRGVKPDVRLSNSLLEVCARLGNIRLAENILDYERYGAPWKPIEHIRAQKRKYFRFHESPENDIYAMKNVYNENRYTIMDNGPQSKSRSSGDYANPYEAPWKSTDTEKNKTECDFKAKEFGVYRFTPSPINNDIGQSQEQKEIDRDAYYEHQEFFLFRKRVLFLMRSAFVLRHKNKMRLEKYFSFLFCPTTKYMNKFNVELSETKDGCKDGEIDYHEDAGIISPAPYVWPRPSAASYNHMMKLRLRMNEKDEVYKLYDDMITREIKPNHATSTMMAAAFRNSPYAFDIMRLMIPGRIPEIDHYVSTIPEIRNGKVRFNPIDLHGLCSEQAEMSVLSHLEALGYALLVEERKNRTHENIKEQNIEFIVGKGIYWAHNGESARPKLREVVMELLNKEGLPFSSPASNPGRIMIKLSEVRLYTDKRVRKVIQESRMRTNYITGAVLTAGGLSAVAVIPKLVLLNESGILLL